MAENVRDVIRAAQAAELGGDKARAIELLRRAATLYRRAGNMARSEHLLRYALRLDPSRAELEDEIGRPVHVRAEEEASLPVPSAPAPDEDPERGVWVLEEDSSSGALAEALRQAELAIDRQRAPAVAEVRREEPRPSPLPEAEGAFIERGPTRADPTLEAWCSFCCRPRAEVGPLVAGPAGAFICSACVGESSALLGGGVAAVPAARVRGSVASRPVSVELVGQEAARASLESGLESGVRRVLLLGPEGCGKSTWMRMLAEQGGVLATPDSLERAPVDAMLLVEDVDRLPAAEQAILGAFLARHPERTVLMTARGNPAAPGPVLLSDSGRLPVPTTAALSEATQGSLPLVLLEQVQCLVPLEKPGVEELSEMARRRLASREDCRLSNEVLTALATEAARSPRSGHELQALLARVPPGTWRLEVKRAKPARRGRRKGTS